MSNQFGIPKNEEEIIRARDKNCVYCGKKMIFPFDVKNRNDSATIEHLRETEPFYWWDGLKAEDITICCGQCNSSRSDKTLTNWFQSPYCLEKNINENTVAEPVKKYLQRIKK